MPNRSRALEGGRALDPPWLSVVGWAHGQLNAHITHPPAVPARLPWDMQSLNSPRDPVPDRGMSIPGITAKKLRLATHTERSRRLPPTYREMVARVGGIAHKHARRVQASPIHPTKRNHDLRDLAGPAGLPLAPESAALRGGDSPIPVAPPESS